MAIVEDKMSMNDSDDIYTLNGEINGPLYAAALSVELVLAFIPNLFIIVYTLCHPKILKQPSMVFLTKLAIVNLLSVVFYIPFAITTASTGEWKFGETDKQRNGVCQVVGFNLNFTGGVSIHMLAVISFDRFLLIVKPLLYRQYMKPRVAVVIVVTVTIYVALQDIAPFYGLGEYAFMPSVASCVPDWINHPGYVAYISVFRTIPVIVIIITTMWTFCFTHTFIRKEKNRRKMTITKSVYIKAEDSVYTRQVCNLIGIFGALLIAMTVSFLPYIVLGTVGLVIGFSNVPDPVSPATLFLFLVNSIAMPTVQIYFRRDLQSSILNGAEKVKALLQKCAITKHERDAYTQTNEEKNRCGADELQSSSVVSVTCSV